MPTGPTASVTALSVSRGSTAGGTEIKIRGSNLPLVSGVCDGFERKTAVLSTGVTHRKLPRQRRRRFSPGGQNRVGRAGDREGDRARLQRRRRISVAGVQSEL